MTDPEGEMDSRSEKGWTVIWLLGFAAIVTVHVVWELLDESLPVWDMAYHQLQGWTYLAAWREGRFFDQFDRIFDFFFGLIQETDHEISDDLNIAASGNHGRLFPDRFNGHPLFDQFLDTFIT